VTVVNKLFLEELKYIIQCEVPLTTYRLTQLEEKFSKRSELIIEMYQLLFEKRHVLLFIDNLEAAVYEYLVNREISNAKTRYGAVLFVATLFGETPTYIKCKIAKYQQSSISNMSA